MDNTFHIKISVPTDNAGYVLLKCSYCGVFFKAIPSDIEDESILELFCPSCGLSSDNYITEDVLELALAKTSNKVKDMFYSELKKMERQFKNGLVELKVDKPPKHETENPIHSYIDALVITNFLCCNKNAKVKPILKMTGCYCPFCGVKNYETE